MSGILRVKLVNFGSLALVAAANTLVISIEAAVSAASVPTLSRLAPAANIFWLKSLQTGRTARVASARAFGLLMSLVKGRCATYDHSLNAAVTVSTYTCSGPGPHKWPTGSSAASAVSSTSGSSFSNLSSCPSQGSGHLPHPDLPLGQSPGRRPPPDHPSQYGDVKHVTSNVRQVARH